MKLETRVQNLGRAMEQELETKGIREDMISDYERKLKDTPEYKEAHYREKREAEEQLEEQADLLMLDYWEHYKKGH